MRLLLGIILGFAITVGGAYVSDHSDTSPTARPMVNWDVVATNFEGLTAMVRDGWRRITG